MAAEQAMVDAGHHAGGVDDVEGIVPQMKATPGMPFRQAVARRRERVRDILHTLPREARIAIQESLDETTDYGFYEGATAPLEGAADVH